MAAGPLHGRWFDGVRSQAREVRLFFVPGVGGPGLRIEAVDGLTQPFTLTHSRVGWPEAWSASRAPRVVVVDLRERGSLEVADGAAWAAARAQAGGSLPLAQRMQTRWPVLLAVFAIAAAGLWAFYRWGTPWAATQLTAHVPLAWETALSQRALADMDGRLLKPSKLPAARQAQLRARFEALAGQLDGRSQRYPGYRPPLSLQFRSGMGANAFALPGGTIVMTDGIVAAAEKANLGDEALVGVLAHEIGHVMHRHTTRIVVEQGVLNVGLGLALGDVSSVLSVGGSLLTGLAYRRGHEGEADCFALALMKRAGLPTAPMAELLVNMEGAQGAGPAAEWLSSHPVTQRRAESLRAGRGENCPA